MGPLEGGEALEVVPAEVGAVRGAEGQVVDLLEAVLPDVPDRDSRLAGMADQVEREAVGIAQTERVVRHGAAGRVDAQQLAEPGVGVLRVVRDVPRAAAIAGARIEEAIRSELQLAAVVVRLAGVGDEQEAPERARWSPPAARLGVQLGDLDVPGAAGEVDVE